MVMRLIEKVNTKNNRKGKVYKTLKVCLQRTDEEGMKTAFAAIIVRRDKAQLLKEE